MTHPSEELLIQHAYGLTDLGDHLRECRACARDVEAILSAATGVSSSSLPDQIHDLESTIREERSAAMELLEATPDDRLDDVIDDDRLFTDGGIAVLIGRLATLRRHDPMSAMGLINRVREQSDVLPDDLRAEILRESASTCRVLGAYESAREMLNMAEDIAEDLAVSDYALARIWYERARVAIDAQEPGGSTWAERAAETFLRFGDDLRHQRSRYLTAVARYNDRDYAGTVAALEILLPLLEEAGDAETEALSWSMIGHACVKEDWLDEAESAFRRALELFDRLDWPLETLRARWGIARALLKKGDAEAAASIAEETRAEFRDHGLIEESSLVALDLAEALLIVGEEGRAADLCRDVVNTLSGQLASPDEQRALAYLRESTLTPATIHVVSTFLHDYREDPRAEFAPASVQ
ncbi:MAG: hypothetical protein R3338_04910 [Thermoanaerobaculia bacterium]|nr:hypothetical protein [Thermoanaerobaculia bacterium]